MGLYPVNNASNSTAKMSQGEIRSLKDDRGMPPMKVRRSAQHKAEAEQGAISASIDGY
jgi:hypothetical protein